jgi:hypothetical protein
MEEFPTGPPTPASTSRSIMRLAAARNNNSNCLSLGKMQKMHCSGRWAGRKFLAPFFLHRQEVPNQAKAHREYKIYENYDLFDVEHVVCA